MMNSTDLRINLERLADLDEFVAREMAGWKVPGVALAVVTADRVVASRGYGFRDREAELPMTPATVCPIASVTKSMTVATLAVLVRQGKLEWDRPVREYLPGFRLFDGAATDRVTPRDLVTHRTGLPRHDAVWYGAKGTTPSRESLVERLRYLQPSADLRERWQYNNLMYVTAGYLAGHVAGSTWEEAIRRLLFEPLGMSAGTSITDLLRTDEFGYGYEKDDADEVHRSPFYDTAGADGIDPIGPAGSVVASIDDLTKYLRMQLGSGTFEGREILTESDTRAMQTAQMVMPDAGSPYPELGPNTYGMGFQISTYRARKFVRHGGNIDGFSILLAFLPDDGIGVAAIANLSGSTLPTVLTLGVFDRLLGLDGVDWSARYHENEDRAKAAETSAKDQGLTTRRTDTTPAHPLTRYAGQYAHPAYGTVVIDCQPGADRNDLTLAFHGFTSPLHHVHFEVWATPIDKRNRLQRWKVAFDTDWNGDVSSLRVPMESQLDDIRFVRIPDPTLSGQAYLKPLVGAYAVNVASVFRISMLETGALQLTVPGSLSYSLIPVRAGVFDVTGLAGCRVEVVRAERSLDGAVTGIAIHANSGSFIAARQD